MKASDCVTGIREKVSDPKKSRWEDDEDFLPYIGQAQLAIFRRRPESICLDDDTLPFNTPSAPTELTEDLAIRDEFQEAVELYVAYVLLGQKGNDRKTVDKSLTYYDLFKQEVLG